MNIFEQVSFYLIYLLSVTYMMLSMVQEHFKVLKRVNNVIAILTT